MNWLQLNTNGRGRFNGHMQLNTHIGESRLNWHTVAIVVFVWARSNVLRNVREIIDDDDVKWRCSDCRNKNYCFTSRMFLGYCVIFLNKRQF